MALGVALALLGGLAIGYPVAATVTTAELFGVLLLAAGVVEAAGAFRAGRGRFVVHLLCGLLAAFLGLALIDRPLLGAVGYTLVLAVFFVASGLVRVVFALSHRFAGWGWVALNGSVGLVLGVMIWRELPAAALWVIGTFVGIDLVFNGVSWVIVGLTVRRISYHTGLPTEPALTRA